MRSFCFALVGVLVVLVLVKILFFQSSDNSGGNLRYKEFVYKQPTAAGLVCIFYSDSRGLAAANAQMYASDHEEKYGVPLIVRANSY